MKWECTVPGKPRQKGNSKSAFKSPKMKFAVVVTPDSTKKAEHSARAVIAALRPEKPFAGPIAFDVEFRFAMPKTEQEQFEKWNAAARTVRRPPAMWPGDPCMRKVDRGNLLKLIEDAANGLVYLDDSQIVAGDVSKVWAFVDETHIVVTELGFAARAWRAARLFVRALFGNIPADDREVAIVERLAGAVARRLETEGEGDGPS